MKKLALILTILIMFPLSAETESDSKNEYKMTGFILEIRDNLINFEEAWFPATAQHSSSKAHRITTPPIAFSDESGNQISHADIIAPCMVEISYIIDQEGDIRPVRIKILEQYRYDDHGFIKELGTK